MNMRLFVATLLVLLALPATAAFEHYTLPQRLTMPSDMVFTPDGRGWIATSRGQLLRFVLVELQPHRRRSLGSRAMVVGIDQIEVIDTQRHWTNRRSGCMLL